MKIFCDWVVRNEEQFLEKSLLSVLPYVDGGVVVDTGSTDRTIEIVKDVQESYPHLKGPVSIDIGPHLHISKARNAALQHIPGKFWIDDTCWCVVLAGDEVYDDSAMNLREELEQLSESVKWVWPITRSIHPNGSFLEDVFLRPSIYKHVNGMHWIHGFGSEGIMYANGDSAYCSHCNPTARPDMHAKLSGLTYEHYLFVRSKERSKERDRMYMASQHGVPFRG